MGQSNSTRGKSKSMGPSVEILCRDCTQQHMATLLEMLKRINQSTTLNQAVHKAIESTTALLDCDRATMFIVDEITDQLVVRDASNSVDIKIPMTAGIAGSVYTGGELFNIPDAYSEPKFNKETDAKTGYTTKSILCCPVYNHDGTTVAVLQAINKKSSDDRSKFVPFTKEDETLIDYMAGQLGVILMNAKIYEDSVRSKKKVEAMLDIVRSLHGDMGVNSVSFTLTERTPQLVDADRCTLYLVDEKRSELWTISGGVQIRIPKSSGIAGLVATSGEVVNIPDAYKDPRFNKDFDMKSGFHTKTILCLPIKNSDNDVVGVLQLINKLEGAFTRGDEELLEGFLVIVGGIIANSHIFTLTQGRERKGTQFGATEQPAALIKEKSTKVVKPMGTFAEDEEEEEEED
mmetsp:Transcript_6328/g.12499  ORF Transcript_6328/g.12499 Transcript_6328/m.12499 type:complete len:404 (+) Transcript_6328:46-1257(+)